MSDDTVADPIWETSACEEWATPQVDWNAAIDDVYTVIETEPDPPVRKPIYPLSTQPGWKVTIKPHDPAWHQQFLDIRCHIATLLRNSKPAARFTSIEHIGSTSIPALCAKPNLDILVTFPSRTELDLALEAFAWEVPTSPPFIRYTRIRNGGSIRGRESLKLYIPEDSPYYATIPVRSVYLINENADNPAGRTQIRCYRDVKATLCEPGNKDLLDEYARVKMELAGRIFPDSITYSRLKDGIIRKILLRAGWKDAEIDEKESLSCQSAFDDEPPY